MADKRRRRKRGIHGIGQIDMVADINMDMEFELVTGVGKLDPNFFDPKLTRLAHLLSFASFFLSNISIISFV